AFRTLTGPGRHRGRLEALDVGEGRRSPRARLVPAERARRPLFASRPHSRRSAQRLAYDAAAAWPTEVIRGSPARGGPSGLAPTKWLTMHFARASLIPCLMSSARSSLRPEEVHPEPCSMATMIAAIAASPAAQPKPIATGRHGEVSTVLGRS